MVRARSRHVRQKSIGQDFRVIGFPQTTTALSGQNSLAGAFSKHEELATPIERAKKSLYQAHSLKKQKLSGKHEEPVREPVLLSKGCGEPQLGSAEILSSIAAVKRETDELVSEKDAEDKTLSLADVE